MRTSSLSCIIHINKVRAEKNNSYGIGGFLSKNYV